MQFRRLIGFSLALAATVALLILPGCSDSRAVNDTGTPTDTAGDKSQNLDVAVDSTSDATPSPDADAGPADTIGDRVPNDTGPLDGPPLPDTAGATPTSFRIVTLSIADPHIYLTCAVDLTSTLAGLIAPQLTADGDNDGLLDLSFVVTFRPLSQGTAMGTVELAPADCKAPHPTSGCERTLATQPTFGISTYNNQTTGTCLGRTANGTNVSRHNAAETTGPCFASTARTVTLTLAGINIPLRELQVAGRYNADPATGLEQGLLRGFLTRGDAQQTLLPATLPLVGGQPLSGLLCDQGANSDLDTHPTFGPGWWFFINYTATKVTYTEK